jgi:hypothetical protein
MNFPLNYLKVLNFSPKKHLAFFTLLLCFFIRCIFGRMHFCLPCVLAFLIFLFVFLCILRRFLVYTFNVLRGAPYAFIKFHLLIKKKNFFQSSGSNGYSFHVFQLGIGKWMLSISYIV